MKEKPAIRESAVGDLAAIEKLYPEVFPDEDLLPLVRELLQQKSAVLSLVATMDNSLVGHVIFTICGIENSAEQVALLGPLAVASALQKQGIGSAIVNAGLQRMDNMGMAQVLVLGDPAYYGRFGFLPNAEVMPPYALPAEWREAWQVKHFRGNNIKFRVSFAHRNHGFTSTCGLHSRGLRSKYSTLLGWMTNLLWYHDKNV